MKNLLIILTICTLNGCGLFKKTYNKNTSLEESKIKTYLDVSKKTSDVKIDKSIKTNNAEIKSDESIKIIPTKGTIVKIDSSGNITFQADSLFIKKSNFKKSNSNENLNLLQQVAQEIDSSRNDNIANKNKTSSEVKVSTPQSFPIISNYIGSALFLVIIIVAIIFIAKKRS